MCGLRTNPHADSSPPQLSVVVAGWPNDNALVLTTIAKFFDVNPGQWRDGLSLYHNCDSTTIRLRHDYDEKLTCSFFARVESRRVEAGVSQSNCNFDHFRRSRMRRGIVVS